MRRSHAVELAYQPCTVDLYQAHPDAASGVHWFGFFLAHRFLIDKHKHDSTIGMQLRHPGANHADSRGELPPLGSRRDNLFGELLEGRLKVTSHARLRILDVPV